MARALMIRKPQPALIGAVLLCAATAAVTWYALTHGARLKAALTRSSPCTSEGWWCSAYMHAMGRLNDALEPCTYTAQIAWLQQQACILYPWEARQKRYEASVKLSMTIEQDGRISASEIKDSSGYELLDQAALKAVGGFRVDPARLNAERFPYQKSLRLTFRLEE